MGVYNFLKSKLGKATMVGTTAATGTAANFIVADSIKEDVKYEAIKSGIKDAGVDVNTLTRDEILDGWATVKASIENGYHDDFMQTVYDNVTSNLDKVDIATHYQPQTITGTCAVAAVTAIAWVALYLISKRKANKVAKVKVEDIK